MKKTKMKFAFLLLVPLGCTVLHAQQATVAAGGDATGVGGTSSYSVGQVVYTGLSGSSGTSNQGVQQPYEILTVGISNNENINLSYSVYPNPAVSSITLSIGDKNIENLSYKLYDIAGKLLANQKVANALTIISMESYAAATYLLKVSDNTGEIKTFKIIKNK